MCFYVEGGSKIAKQDIVCWKIVRHDLRSWYMNFKYKKIHIIN